MLKGAETTDMAHSAPPAKRRGRPPKSRTTDAPAKTKRISKASKKVEAESSNEEDEEVYEVEKIMQVKVTHDYELRYLIKWKGYSSEYNTWQSLEDLHCPELMDDFKSRLFEDASLDATSEHLTFPPAPSKCNWELFIESVVGMREMPDGQIAARILWFNGSESEETIEDCMEAAPRPVLRFLMTKLKFKTV